QPGNIDEHELDVVDSGNPEVRGQRGKWIGADLRLGPAQGSQQARLPRVRSTDQAHIGYGPQLELEPALFTGLALPRHSGCSIRGRREMRIAQAALPRPRHADGLPIVGNVGNDARIVGDQGAQGNLDGEIRSAFSVLVSVGAVSSAISAKVCLVLKR